MRGQAVGKGLNTQMTSWRFSTQSNRKESPNFHSIRRENTKQMKFFLFHFWACLSVEKRKRRSWRSSLTHGTMTWQTKSTVQWWQYAICSARFDIELWWTMKLDKALCLSNYNQCFFMTINQGILQPSCSTTAVYNNLTVEIVESYWHYRDDVIYAYMILL